MRKIDIVERLRNMVEADDEHQLARAVFASSPHSQEAQQGAVKAWNGLQQARERVAEIDARDLLRALTVAEVAAPDRRGRRFTLEEIRSAVARVERGDSLYVIARDTDRNYSSLRVAVRRYMDGTSNLARDARSLGLYEYEEAASE